MRRYRTPWLLALPLMFGGSLTARWLTSVCLPAAEKGGSEAAEHAEGAATVAGQWPLVAGVLVVLVVLGLGQAVSHSLRRTPSRPVPVWLFLCLSPLAFLGQELAEAIGHTEAVTLGPHLLLGLLLQLPFALAAFWAARVLGRLAERFAHVLGALPILAGNVSLVHAALEAELKRLTLFALGYPGRAPPTPT